jgi:dicarboxylate transporter 10
MTYSLTRLGVYDSIKQKLSKNGECSGRPSRLGSLRSPLTPGAKHLGMGELTACASAAGALAGLAGNPADVILVRMITDPTKPPAQQQHYRNALHGVYRMVGAEGVGALFLGMVPNVVRSVIMNASQLVSYDMFKETLQSFGMKDGIPLHFSASALAGTFATTVCSPADVVKSRVMHSSDVGVMHVLTDSFRREGPMFLFRGWLPAWIRLTPNTICTFVFLEQLRHVVDIVRERPLAVEAAAVAPLK